MGRPSLATALTALTRGGDLTAIMGMSLVRYADLMIATQVCCLPALWLGIILRWLDILLRLDNLGLDDLLGLNLGLDNLVGNLRLWTSRRWRLWLTRGGTRRRLVRPRRLKWPLKI